MSLYSIQTVDHAKIRTERYCRTLAATSDRNDAPETTDFWNLTETSPVFKARETIGDATVNYESELSLCMAFDSTRRQI
jgi:hypothetical protein